MLLPTRELAMQVHEQYEQLRGKKMPKAALVIGGVSEKTQIQGLRGGCGPHHRHPGAPCRTSLTANWPTCASIKILVLDEADRMLDMGFLAGDPAHSCDSSAERQTLCFSATMEQSVAAWCMITCASRCEWRWARC